jgi:hypothetical protein
VSPAAYKRAELLVVMDVLGRVVRTGREDEAQRPVGEIIEAVPHKFGNQESGSRRVETVSGLHFAIVAVDGESTLRRDQDFVLLTMRVACPVASGRHVEDPVHALNFEGEVP